jgi:hypothetical protein
MSVRTTADEKLDSAKIHLNAAYKDILEVLDDSTWGHDNYNTIFIDNLHVLALELLKLKRLLK